MMVFLQYFSADVFFVLDKHTLIQTAEFLWLDMLKCYVTSFYYYISWLHRLLDKIHCFRILHLYFTHANYDYFYSIYILKCVQLLPSLYKGIVTCESLNSCVCLLSQTRTSSVKSTKYSRDCTESILLSLSLPRSLLIKKHRITVGTQ